MSLFYISPAQVKRGVLISWLALLVLVIGGQLFPAPSLARLSVGLLYCIPLLIPLRGLLRGDRYTHAWATLCVLPYFIVGVTEAVANPAIHGWSVALLGTSLLWFFMLISFLRVTINKTS